MLETLYDAIHQNPAATAWAFGLVNALWAVFLYFNGKRYERELKKLQHGLDLDLERRKAVFALKVTSYERYVRMLDDFGKKYQFQLLARMQPIVQAYLEGMLNATDTDDKALERQAIATFSNDMMGIMNEASADYAQLKAESRALKLTASNELIRLFDDLEAAVQESMNASNAFMSRMPMLVMAGKQEELQRQAEALSEQGRAVNGKSMALEQRMRSELGEI